jgi:hypothetical protein
MDTLLRAILHIFDEYVFGFMRSDIDAAIQGNANYLAALGLARYTEVLGGLRTGELGVRNRSGKLQSIHSLSWKRLRRVAKSGY